MTWVEYPSSFDREAHQRERLRRLTARVEGLKAERDQLVRLLAAVLAAQFHDTYIDPVEYLQRLTDADQAMLELGL